MGVAAYNRGTQVIRRQTDSDMRDPVFILMDELNSLPKDPGARKPFQAVELDRGNGGWWIACPVSGFGYWYKTLRKAVRAWDVVVTGYSNRKFTAEPTP